MTKSERAWLDWVDSLSHDNGCTTLYELVEQMANDLIKYGGDMGPNGNVCEGIDEGLVLTSGLFESYVRRIRKIARDEMGRDDVIHRQA